MRVPRIHVPGPLPDTGPVPLDGPTLRRLRRVLRLRDGAELVLFDGEGRERRARLRDGPQAHAEIYAVMCGGRESPLRLRLAQGVARGERMDWVVQKAVELGADEIQPLITSRTVVRLDPARARARQRHWQAVAVAACEQCGRSRVPAVAPPLPFAEWLAAGAPRGLGLLLDPGAEAGIEDMPPPAEVELLIGPEGGLADAERAAALEAGFRAVRLGPRTLRTETATVAALALVQHRFGDLGGAPPQRRP